MRRVWIPKNWRRLGLAHLGCLGRAFSVDGYHIEFNRSYGVRRSRRFQNCPPRGALPYRIGGREDSIENSVVVGQMLSA